MELVILIFFIAIFGGILFLLGLVWFVFRRIRNSRSANRSFSGSSNYVSNDNPAHRNFTESEMIYAANLQFANQNSESAIATETAHDSPPQSDNSYSHESHGASAVPAETSSIESNYSSYDSSSDSSSSDSGSSSSSSD